jgi:glycine/D-amino acid oxidase-like deaminating enzyme
VRAVSRWASQRSYWLMHKRGRTRAVVRHPADFDVVVVGGGLTGITTAYLLKREGLRVALVERDRCGEGDTGHTSAHLTYVTDKPLSALAEDLGWHRAQAFWQAGRRGIEIIADIVRRERIACAFDWVPGYLHLPAFEPVRSDAVASLVSDATLASDMGFHAAISERAPLVERPAIRFERQARLEPLRYAEGLLDYVDGEGSAVFEHSDVREILGGGTAVIANGHQLTCRVVIVTTHLPTLSQPALLEFAWARSALARFTSYVIAAEAPSGQVPDVLLWDTADPYRYLRTKPGDGNDILFFGGHDHRTEEQGSVERRFDQLERELLVLVPDASVTRRWSGEVIISGDGLPVIGWAGGAAPRQFIATGFNGNGIPMGTVAAQMAADAVTGRSNPWSGLFVPNRPGLCEPVGQSLKGHQ